MRRVGALVAETIRRMREAVRPGVTTAELDLLAARTFHEYGALSGPMETYSFPGSTCISVNEEVVHGIPGDRKLEAGDIVGLDLGAIVDGFFGDAARTVAVGAISAEAQKLMKVTRESLMQGIAQVRPGNRVGDIGHAVQKHAEAHGYSVVRNFVGHGIGTALHEEPEVPNFGKAGRLARLVPGMCLAIEPMVNAGGPEVKVLDDEWTAVTVDGSLSAHFELTVAVTQEGPWILSEPYPYGQEQRAHA